jgi:hypothetical protein
MKNKIVTIRVNMDDYAVLAREAEKLRVSLSAIIRMKLVKALELG